MIRLPALLFVAFLSLGSCQTPNEPSPPAAAPVEQWLEPQWQIASRSEAYDALPGWDSVDFAPGLSALSRS